MSQRGLLLTLRRPVGRGLRDLTEALAVIGEDPVLGSSEHSQPGQPAHAERRPSRGASRLPGRAVELLRHRRGTRTWRQGRLNLGYTVQMAGDLISALRMLDEVEPRLASLGPLTEATASRCAARSW